MYCDDAVVFFRRTPFMLHQWTIDIQSFVFFKAYVFTGCFYPYSCTLYPHFCFGLDDLAYRRKCTFNDCVCNQGWGSTDRVPDLSMSSFAMLGKLQCRCNQRPSEREKREKVPFLSTLSTSKRKIKNPVPIRKKKKVKQNAPGSIRTIRCK